MIKSILIVSASFFLLACDSGSSESLPTEGSLLKVACVGDSITEGTGLSDPQRESYPAQLAEMLGTGWHVENFGKKGATLLQNGTSPYWNTNQFDRSHTYDPDIVVIMLGTNDAKPANWKYREHFVSDYGKLIESYRTLPSQPHIYICLPPPVFAEVAGITDKRIISEVIPLIKQVSHKYNVPLMDMHSLLQGKGALFPDHIHPDATAAGIIASEVYRVIY
jgi:lysophospholipase L1-like esterase